MATKSILKTIVIKDKKTARALVYALENAKNATPKHVEISKQCSDASLEEVKKIFGEQQ